MMHFTLFLFVFFFCFKLFWIFSFFCMVRVVLLNCYFFLNNLRWFLFVWSYLMLRNKFIRLTVNILLISSHLYWFFNSFFLCAEMRCFPQLFHGVCYLIKQILNDWLRVKSCNMCIDISFLIIDYSIGEGANLELIITELRVPCAVELINGKLIIILAFQLVEHVL